jgi:glycosyltransferase involved in cell wall biosynthesis
MRVLHVLSGLYAGGIEALALQLITNSPEGVEAELLNIDRRVQEQADAFAALQSSGRLTAIHQWVRCDGIQLAFQSFLLCLRCRPDALLIYPCSRPMLWLALGARIAGVRRLVVHLGNTAPEDRSRLRTWHRLLLWFQRLGVVAVPCTQAIVASLQPLPPSLRLGPVIPNGCDIHAIACRASAARETRAPGDERRVLMVGRFDPIKDQATLIRAFANARQPGWKLQLVGDGVERPRLESLANQLGLDPAEVFLGLRNDIPELLGRADLFAFSTTAAEGFGIVLIEAMASSLPVIASDVPACREVLAEGVAGVLLPPRDHNAWSRYLTTFMTQYCINNALLPPNPSRTFSYDIKYIAYEWYRLLGYFSRV